MNIVEIYHNLNGRLFEDNELGHSKCSSKFKGHRYKMARVGPMNLLARGLNNRFVSDYCVIFCCARCGKHCLIASSNKRPGFRPGDTFRL